MRFGTRNARELLALMNDKNADLILKEIDAEIAKRSTAITPAAKEPAKAAPAVPSKYKVGDIVEFYDSKKEAWMFPSLIRRVDGHDFYVVLLDDMPKDINDEEQWISIKVSRGFGDVRPCTTWFTRSAQTRKARTPKQINEDCAKVWKTLNKLVKPASAVTLAQESFPDRLIEDARLAVNYAINRLLASKFIIRYKVRSVDHVLLVYYYWVSPTKGVSVTGEKVREIFEELLHKGKNNNG